jgi:hypothetical protein
MTHSETLLFEDNIISLRTAYVLDNGDLVSLSLTPASDNSVPRTDNPMKRDSTWLYRHKKSAAEELAVMQDSISIRHDIMPLEFTTPPEFRLLWADSGHSVALFLNGEPWAFIHEEKYNGYSKGIISPTLPNPWNQELFEQTFMAT